jgi:hypothetical protein
MSVDVARLHRVLGYLDDALHNRGRRDGADELSKARGFDRLCRQSIHKGVDELLLVDPDANVGRWDRDEEERRLANEPGTLEDVIREAGRLLELAKSAHAPAAKPFLMENGPTFAEALLTSFDRMDDRIAKSSKDFQADISAKVEKISKVVDFVSRTFPGAPAMDDLSISKARTPAPDPAIEGLFRAAATSPDRTTRDALLGQAQAAARKEGPR